MSGPFRAQNEFCIMHPDDKIDVRAKRTRHMIAGGPNEHSGSKS
jgi:hypothetical protein